ncbi:hypothetical protein APY03_5809 [Variovorax sp. WDL1]|nr:hypothetical protein APY03_5809 [Variovorax sp. WDL1]
MVDSGWKLSRHDLLAEFAVLLAGSYAEARQKHTAAVDVMLGGGADDHRQALEVADLLPVERPELIDAGHRMADTFVREYWPAIRAVADLLQGQESTAGDAVHELLDRGAGVRWPMPKGRNYMPD